MGCPETSVQNSCCALHNIEERRSHPDRGGSLQSRIVYIVVGAEDEPWLRRSGFKPVPVHVGFVMYKAALGQVFIGVLNFLPSVPWHRYSISSFSSSNVLSTADHLPNSAVQTNTVHTLCSESRL